MNVLCIINECIMITIRESIPTESIIRAYTDESVEQDEEVFIETMREPEISETKEDIEDVKNCGFRFTPVLPVHRVRD